MCRPPFAIRFHRIQDDSGNMNPLLNPCIVDFEWLFEQWLCKYDHENYRDDKPQNICPSMKMLIQERICLHVFQIEENRTMEEIYRHGCFSESI